MSEIPANNRIAEVHTAYTSAYPDPITFDKGDKLLVGKRDTEWPGWMWCEAPNGTSGWVPEQFIEFDNDSARAVCDYTARELTAKIGDHITVHKTINGWAWGELSTGETGWLPLRNLTLSA